MNVAQLSALAPMLVLGVGATLLMLQIAVTRSPKYSRVTTLLVLVLGLVSCLWMDVASGTSVTPLLRVDALGTLFAALFCASAAVCVLLSRDYLPSL
ncbi:MAG: hypothetical protein V2I38_11705, partial [Alcanivoracaceae bacterium]|nr:hypothetical protein [Alcanivoracaceae bacterium]